jgi:deoxyribodipyrimidine photolyase
MTTLVWFRQDLRLEDNPALHAASQGDGAVIPVYIWSPEDEGDWPPGAASRWWLHQSLHALDRDLRKRGSRLILAKAPASRVLEQLLVQPKATAVYWNRRYDWVPERAMAPDVHAPDDDAIVDLKESRETALDAYEDMRGARSKRART